MTQQEIDDIELTDQEVKDAIYEAKKKKYFHEKNKEYWEKQEGRRNRREVSQ